MSKAAYALAQRQTRAHTCHWSGCVEQVSPAMWGCRKALPKPLRDPIWRAYRLVQEKDMRPSGAYVDAACKVQAWVKEPLLRMRALHKVPLSTLKQNLKLPVTFHTHDARDELRDVGNSMVHR
jgi:hypothetical protein